MKTHRTMLWLAALALGTWTNPALAAAPDAASAAPDALDRSRALFREASAQAERGEWQRALELYREAHATYPHASTLYNIGYSELQLGHLDAALEATSQALDDSAFEPSRRLSAERRSAAEATKHDILARLAVRDSEAPTPAGLADSGERPGPTPKPASRPLVLTPRGDVPRDDARLPPPLPRQNASDQDGLRSAAYATLAAGGVGLLLAGVSVVVLVATDGKLESACPERRCPASEAGAVRRYQLAATLTNVGLLAGGAGAAVGTGLLVYSF